MKNKQRHLTGLLSFCFVMSNLDKQIIIFQYSTHLFNITLLVFFVHSDTEKYISNSSIRTSLYQKVNHKKNVLRTYSVPVLSVRSLIFFPSFPMIAPTMLCGTRTLPQMNKEGSTYVYHSMSNVFFTHLHKP